MSDFIDRISNLSQKRLILLATDLQSRLEAAAQAKPQPIAIIGMGLRFPGGANSPETFWDFLKSGGDAVGEVPADRWNVEEYFDPDPEIPGKMNTRYGAFLQGIDQFDPQFFGITPREAVTMDPQQRMVLEVAWEALENAGYAPDGLTGSSTGVFIGACNHDYMQMVLATGDRYADMYMSTGSAHSVISGRLSYLLGLNGPAVTLDTACSSALVAIHSAYLSLKKGDCRVALAGGVNAILSPETTVTLSSAKMLAPDGHCKAFDSRADGFVRGEGCGILVLKRLDDALADNDHILAVIRGSAINQDGRSNGLTAPNGPSQVSVVRAALAEAGLTPADISYIETHGTGTSLGDPIEIQALGEALGPGHTKDHPLLVGSVKTNLGHLESAAGVAGIAKLVLALQHRQIPPHLHLQKLNPHIAWDELPIAVPTQLSEWEPTNGRWIGGVSSFGFSGTNVHLIIESAPEPVHRTAEVERPIHLLRLSARARPALEALSRQVQDHLANQPELLLSDVAYTLNVGRGTFNHRLAFTAATLDEARSKLSAFSAGQEAPGMVSANTGNRHPQVAFLFTGSGAQYLNMGRDLYETQPIFREALDRCEALLRSYLPQPLLSVLYAPESAQPLLDRMLYTQAATFAIQYALVQLWQSWGIVPAAVMGHSLGEYTAAVTAGILSLEDGIRLVVARGRLMDAITTQGVMYAVFANASAVQEAIASLGGQVSIAAINGPENLVISGPAGVVEQAITRLEGSGVKCRRLAISQAGHSPLIDPILDEFEREASAIHFSPPQIELFSSLFGRPLAPGEAENARYWSRHLREPVQFYAAVQKMHEQFGVMIEIGSDPVLISMAQRALPGSSTVWVPSLRKGKEDWQQILESLAAVYTAGVEVDWQAFDQPYPRQRISLPTYPFQRQRYWVDTTPTPSRSSGRPSSGGGHPLLESQIRSPGIADTIYEAHLTRKRPAFLEHHRVYGTVILPSPAYLEMALEAGERIFGKGPHGIENFSIQSALELPETGEATVQMVVKPAHSGRASFQVFSLDETTQTWRKHASGELVRSPQIPQGVQAAGFDPADLQARCTKQIDGKAYYEKLAAMGLEFGTRFRGVDHVWRREGEALGRICLPEELAHEQNRYHFHPAFLDACFHLVGAPLPGDDLESSYLLVGIERLHLYRKPEGMLWDVCVLDSQQGVPGETFSGSIRLYDQAGNLVAEAAGLDLKRAGREAFMRGLSRPSHNLREDWLYQVDWQPSPLSAPALEEWPAPVDIAQSLANRAAALEGEPEYASYQALAPHLDALSVQYIRQAFEQIGLPLNPGQFISAEQVSAVPGILPRYQPLMRRLLDILSETGVLEETGDRWRVTGQAPALSGSRLSDQFPAYQAEIALLETCGPHLASVLQGSTDPLHLLFPGGSSKLVEPLYGQSPYARAFNTLIAEALRGSLPAAGTVRILEIGAGTGSTTSGILPLLDPTRSEYVFSDLSPLFLDRARQAFSSFPFMRYQLLDIEKDPAAQGVIGQTFDVIIAANVLHATSNLAQSLRYVRSLLNPGGLLLLLEGTRRLAMVDLTFGLTEGWWRFHDHNLRPDHPLLSQPQWLDLLSQSGFEAASLPGLAQGSLSGQELFLARAGAPQAPQDKGWLIFADRGRESTGQALADLLRSRGASTLTVTQSDIVHTPAGEDCWEIRPDDAQGFRKALNSAPAGGWQGILYLWSLDLPTLPRSSEADAVIDTCESVLRLAQETAALPVDRLPAVWLVTRNALQVGAETNAGLPEAGQSPLWGFGRTLTLEHPELWAGLVDLDSAASPAENARLLLAEINQPGGEDQIAYRQGTRFAARLERTRLPQGNTVEIHPDASYLITGGLGGLGLKAARWLVDKGARSLVLVGRRGLPPRESWGNLPAGSEMARRAQAVQNLEALGASVTALPVDIGSAEETAALFARFGNDLPPLRGILHTAADLSNHTIEELDAPALQAMFRPKAAGAWNLHRCSQGMDLDFFVLFSSTTALLGSKYLAHYAAANQFLDSFAAYRRGLGLPAISINWGTWDTMRAANQQEQQMVSQFGLDQMPAEQALDMMGYLMGTSENAAQITVAAVQWNALRAAYEARRRRPFLANLTDAAQVEASPASEAPGQPALAALAERTRAEDLTTALQAYVQQQVALVTGSSTPNAIDIQQGLFEMGLDSLMSVELKNRLETGLGQALPSTLTFNYPTVAELAGYLQERLLNSQPKTGSVQAAQNEAPLPAQTTPDEIDDMSEDELAGLLAKRLSRNK